VLHDGPLSTVETIVRESLALLGCAVPATVPFPPLVPT